MKKLNFNEFERGVFLVNLLAVIKKDGKILIGRRENDPYIKKLTWSFPGGRPDYGDDLEKYLSLEIKKKTNLDAEIKDVIFTKTYPENRQFLSIYFTAEITGGEEKAGEKFKELKWVKPEELKTHFTTSLHPKLLEIIKGLK